MKANIKRMKELSTTKRYRVTDGFNFLYLDSNGFPRWRDEEYSTTFPTRRAAQSVIDGCGLRNTMIEIVPAN